MRYTGAKTLDTQTTMFDEVVWEDTPGELLLRDRDTPFTGRPPGARPGMPSTSEEAQQGRIPFWEFTWRVDSVQGLVITNAVARGTQPSTSGTLSTERVFQRIDFTDLVVTLDDGSSVPFNVTRALGGAGATFALRRNGRRFTVDPADPLMQYGLQLRLTDNVLTGAGTCNVTLEFVVVLRGAINDFDPGGVPVAMGCYPQLAWTWSAEGATKRVRKFRGSVRITADNVMAGEHVGHGGGNAPASNVPGFYTDSNTSFDTLGNFTPVVIPHNPRSAGIAVGGMLSDNRASIYGLTTVAARVRGLPASWGMVFDYLYANFTQEKEIVAVYGKEDGNYYTAATPRRANYIWPSTPGHDDYNRFVINKAARQGQYDNIHVHAEMPDPDVYGNVQIHAPFCGHSCVHMHWRWSATAGRGAKERSWYFNGWSNPLGGMPTAHSTPNAPLVPPNQRVKVAICAPRAARHDENNIINPAAPALLPQRNKMIWYSADILQPAAGRKQVICEHGLGWAYRYAMPGESDAILDSGGVDGLAGVLFRGQFLPSPPRRPATQLAMSDYFENYVYPKFRYVDWFGTRINQIPNGDYCRTHVWGSTTPAPPIRAEDL
jgi:hypothetical protein